MSSKEVSPELKKEIFDKLHANKTEELKALLAANKIKIDFVDEHGMSPLQHICYKGNKEMAQLLLDLGADPNDCHHEHKYTALLCAALSGNADLCQLLMSYGAKRTATNSIGRTAAQMAAFVGNHQCVTVINNFIPKADIDFYLKPQGLNYEPMLHPHLVDSFHLFIIQVNVHPVRVVLNLQRFPGLMENLPMIQKVLQSMCKKEMTKGAETNEVMAFKYHYLSYIVAEVVNSQKRKIDMIARAEKKKLEEMEKNKNKIVAMQVDEQKEGNEEIQVDEQKEGNEEIQVDEQKEGNEEIQEVEERKEGNEEMQEVEEQKEGKEEKSEEKKSEIIETLIKKFLKPKSGEGPVVLQYQELFLREAIREFNYRESTIFHQMVATLTGSDPPTAMSVISAAINGQRVFSDPQICITCGEEKASKKCSKCKMVQYCDRECQRLHWFVHKKACNRLSQSIATNRVPEPNSEETSD